MIHKIFVLLIAIAITNTSFAQPTQTITDPEKSYKEVKELVVKEQYALAYPLLKALKKEYHDNTASDHTYLNDDISYFYILCGLKMMQPLSVEDASLYIASINNQPRRELLSFHLGHYYFLTNDFSKAIESYDLAGYDNLGNDQIADAKFEKAYALFNLKQFERARPLFNEIHQLPSNKYYIPANYYYGYISYGDKQYGEALKSFKLVETFDEYKGVVPYYIAEIYYFQGKKEDALTYGESVLGRGTTLYYEKQLKLLTGQLYFEKQNYKKALPLLDDYVNSSEKVTKEILYELSYSNYKEGRFENAINGFKQLSNERDSMGQNSMYILGDLYLKTNRKANARTAFQYSAYNNSNAQQQKSSRFNYAKLSYELGYQDVALAETKRYIKDYPSSENDTEAKEILVSLLANTSNFTDALALYESFEKPTTAMQKVYPRILYGKAIDYINDQQPLQADILLDKVLANPSSGSIIPYAHFWKGEIAFKDQRYDEAIRNLSFFIQANPVAQGEANMVNAKYTVGYCYFQKENYRQSLSFFEQISSKISITSSPLEQDAYVRSADCYFMLKDFTRANTMYDNMISNAFLQSDYAMFQKSMIAGIKSSTEKIRILNSISRQYPKSNLIGEANMEIAMAYIADEKFKDALPYLDLIITSADNGLKPKAYLKSGLANYNNDNNKNALISYQALIEKYPRSPEATEALASIKDIYVEDGQPNEYVDLMRKNGINISTSEADSLTYAAAFLKYNNDDCASAISGFTNYISKFPESTSVVEANYLKGECYQKNKDWPNALKGYGFVSSKGISKYYEKATLEAARINYFELKDYSAASEYFNALIINSVNQENVLEALRGAVRSYYALKDYSRANDAAKELLSKKGISTDDKSIGFLVLGKSQQVAKDCPGAITSFKSAAAINKSAWGAEARFEIANCYFSMDNDKASEKAALAVIKETGSYDTWVTSAYLLLGDIFIKEKDYFNAKATYESVATNATIPELKLQAKQKLENAIAEEKLHSKITN